MNHVILPKRKAEALSNAALLVGLALLFWFQSFWPSILVVIWVWLAIRQYLTSRKWDLIITSVVLLGLFVVSFFGINLSSFIPILFVVGALYIIFREYFFADDSDDATPSGSQ